MTWVGEEKLTPRGAIKKILPEMVREEKTDVRNRLQITLTTGWMGRAEVWVIPRFHVCGDNCEIHGQQRRGRRLSDIVRLKCLRVTSKELEGEQK